MAEFDMIDATAWAAMLLGAFSLAAAIYLANPWIPADILTCIMKAIGGIMMIEALVVLAFSDLYFHFWLRNLAHMQRAWVVVTLVFGLALTVAGLMRLA